MKTYFDNPEIIAGITLKEHVRPINNSVSLHTGHDASAVLENREHLAQSIGLPLTHFVSANQTHSDHFYHVTTEDFGRGALTMEDAIQDTDALYTYEPNIVLTSYTADCVPVLFYHETNGLIGAIHSGWQGTVKEITKKLFTHLKNNENCNLNQLHVQLGMALSQEKFEVDEDVYTKFKQLGYADEMMYFNEQTKKYHIDNQLVVKKQCELAGVPTENITVDRTCTFLNKAGFSYREDRKCGRHVSYIVRENRS